MKDPSGLMILTQEDLDNLRRRWPEIKETLSPEALAQLEPLLDPGTRNPPQQAEELETQDAKSDPP